MFVIVCSVFVVFKRHGAARKDSDTKLRDYIRLVLKHAGHTRSSTGLAHVTDPIDILQFESVPAGEVKYYLIVLPQNLPCITAFEATFFEMEVAEMGC